MFKGLPHLFRLLRAGYILSREGVFSLIDPDMLPIGARAGVRFMRIFERRGLGIGETSRAGERLARAMTRLGPFYVKLGQFLASRPDIVGLKVAQDLGQLQDRMPSFPQEEALAILQGQLHGAFEDHFQSLSQPIAAASIAQVHQGILKDGRKVAVKILRPNIRQRFARDLAAMRFVAEQAEKNIHEAIRLRFVSVVQTLERSMTLEMDLRLEAAALSEFRENTRDDPDFRVPEPNWEYTTREILVSEWIDATAIHDLKALDDAGQDRKRLARVLVQSFLKQAIGDGFFHADMHQGNLMIDPQGKLVAVDGGIMGRLGVKERRFLAEILLGFITRDYLRISQVHFEAGYVPKDQSMYDFAQALRAVGEPIHGRSAEQISMANLLGLLFEITCLFDMRTRTELVMLQKTMVVVEGVARTLDPALDIWRTSEPVVRAWMTDNLGPKGRLRDAGTGFASLLQAASRLPDALNRFADEMERGETRDTPTFPPSRATISHKLSTLALWIIATLLGFIVWQGM
jgi:ubiquinone biosynthesis protein